MIALILFAASVSATPVPPARTWDGDAKTCASYVCGCPVSDNACSRFIMTLECIALLTHDPKLLVDQYDAAARVCFRMSEPGR